jgi:hypothetical protein
MCILRRSDRIADIRAQSNASLDIAVQYGNLAVNLIAARDGSRERLDDDEQTEHPPE